MTTPERPRRRGFPIAVVVAVVLVIYGLSAQGYLHWPHSSTNAVRSVVYLVDGSGSANLTLTTPTGQTQITASLPLKNRTGTAGLRFQFNAGGFLYLSAQNEGGGEITCRIEVDGVVVSANTAQGQFNIATCQGQA